MTVCVVNNIKENTISAFDRGLAYGDGVFTTAKIAFGVIEMQEAHIARLKTSCTKLCIAGVDFDALSAQITALALSHELAVLKVIITAGQGGRGYSRVGATSPNIVVSVHPFPEHYKSWQKNGITLADSQLAIGINPLLSGIKHLNRLEQVLLRQELDKNSVCDDLVVYNINQKIVETTSSNLFWYAAKQWFTAKIVHSGVNGLVRQAILSAYPDIIEIEAEQDALENAQAIFICNSVMGVVPVRDYNNRPLSITPVVDLVNGMANGMAKE